MLKQQEEPDFYKDLKLSKQVNQKIKSLQSCLNKVQNFSSQLKDLEEFIAYLENVEDENMLKEVQTSLASLENNINELYYETLLSGKFDACNAFLKIHSGAGGTESCDWAEMLCRMYLMYAEKKGYSASITDYVEGDGAGYKSVELHIQGENAYGYLKGEMGVHRLVRISPFDANKRRHTSFASVEVMPEVEENTMVEVNPNDIRIDTFRASGAGGQHINKTESAIRITHFPTGVVVTCQNERSQIQNREMAMKMLISKLVAIKEEENRNAALKLKGESKKIEWGSQIRSYVFCPYTMVNDNRTNLKITNIESVMNGNLDELIFAYLKWEKN